MACLYSVKAARAIAAVHDPEKTRFVVGTLCLREDNQARGCRPLLCVRALTRLVGAKVHVLDYDAERNSVRAQVYGHKYEVWQLAPSPTNSGLLATCYSDATGATPLLLLFTRGSEPPASQARAAAPRCGDFQLALCRAMGACSNRRYPLCLTMRSCSWQSRAPGPGPRLRVCNG